MFHATPSRLSGSATLSFADSPQGWAVILVHKHGTRLIAWSVSLTIQNRLAEAVSFNVREFDWPYFRDVLMDVNLVLTLVPSPFTAAMMASEIPAAIKPYSMAVAPVSSARNLRKAFMCKLSSANFKAR
jgi:hypothetical protein